LGSPAEVLKAVTKYGSLEKLDQELQTKRKELDRELQTKREKLETLAAEMESRSRELDTAGKRLEGVQKQAADLRRALAAHRRLEAIGFDEKALGELGKAGKKYGAPRKVLAALNRFAGLSDIKAKVEELEDKVSQKRAMVKSLDEQYSHLKEPIELCKRLLKRKFGLSALQLINITAWRYGEPTEVMKAIEAYGALKEINKETDQAKTALAEIKGKVEAEKETFAEYSARNKAVLDQLEALNAKSIEVGRTVGIVQEQIKKDSLARDILTLLQNPALAGHEEYSPLVLVLLNSISIWANINRSKFRFSSLIDKNLQEVVGYLGGS